MLMNLTTACHRPLTRRLNQMALASGLALCLSAQTHLANADMPPTPALVKVSASASLESIPDKAIIEAQLWEKTPAHKVDDKAPDSKTEGEVAQAARQTLESRMTTLIKSLETAGIDSRQINAGSLTLRPEQYYERNDGQQSPQQWRRTHIERPITLSLDEIEQVPNVIDLLLSAGVNQLADVQYRLSERGALEDKVLQEALTRAHHKAQLMAETLGATLGSVQSVSESSQSPRPQMRVMMSDMAETKSGGSEYRPGELNLESSVQVSWHIESAD